MNGGLAVVEAKKIVIGRREGGKELDCLQNIANSREIKGGGGSLSLVSRCYNDVEDGCVCSSGLRGVTSGSILYGVCHEGRSFSVLRDKFC